jgi:N-acetylneuraminic acid mutarotase
MAHDIFISYAAEDKPTADAVCATLEAGDIRCWIAPRDVLPGQPYAESLVEAIHDARLMVLVFSSNSNSSTHVMREVERAASRGIPILPFRIEDVPLSASMEYYISSTHWLDALTPPLERHLKQLADTAQLLLARYQSAPVQGEPEPDVLAPAGQTEGAAPPATGMVKSGKPWSRFPRLLLPLGVGATVVVAIIIGVMLLSSGGQEGIGNEGPSALPAVIAATTATTLMATTTAVATTEKAVATTALPMAAPNAWTNLAPAGDVPAARSGHSMVYDSLGSKVVLFGGESSRTWHNDTWVYDPASNIWTTLNPAGDVPSARSWMGMVHDRDIGRAILFGGWNAVSCVNDTWSYDLASDAWTNLNPIGDLPSARSGHSMVYDSAFGNVILFGGWDGTGCLNDTWAYDPVDNVWTELDPAGEVPSPRYSYSMVYDSATGKVILFGGWDSTSYLNDTWAYNPADNIWTELDPVSQVPSARHRHSMVYNSSASRVILFGGWAGTGCLNDTWAYDPVDNVWTELDPAGEVPSARNLFSMAYNSSTSRVILFGGWSGLHALQDTWAYTPASTTISTTTTVPATTGTTVKQTTATQRAPTTQAPRPPTTTTTVAPPTTQTTSVPPTFAP